MECGILQLNRILKRFNNSQIRTAVDLAHTIYGDKFSKGLPILVLHGFLGNKRNWQSACNRIQKITNRMILALDARNHGQSPHVSTHTYDELAADVSALMDKLRIDKASIVGHSMGGRTGMVLALTEPSKVSSLVAVDISPLTSARALNEFFPQLLQGMKGVQFNQVRDVREARILAKTQLKNYMHVDDGTLDFIVMNIDKKQDNSVGWDYNLDALEKCFADVASFPNDRMSGKQYKGPTLFVAGEDSDYVPRGDLAGIKHYFPNVELVYVRNAGHNVHVDNINDFSTIVSNFILKT